MYFDPLWIALMVVTLIIGGVTQGYINSTFRRWSKVPLDYDLSGAEVARRILDSEGLANVGIGQVAGELTDHYDPRSKTLALSGSVHGRPSVAAASVAAHEAGHAIQDARHYVWGNVRSALVPVANFGSQAAWPLIFLGFFIQATSLIWLGIVAYSLAVLFQIVTLPVEFDASKRALAALQTSGVMSPAQLGGARQVLTAAALTYVGATLISVLQLLYFVTRARD